MTGPRSILDLPDEAAGPLAGSARPAPRHDDGDRALLAAVRDVLLAAFDGDARRRVLDPFAPPPARNEAVIAALRAAVARHRQAGGPLAGVPDDAETLLGLFADTLGWGPAQPYLNDPLVNEVKINGRTIMVQEAGRPFVVVPERFATAAEVRARVVQLAAVLGVQLDAAHPQETLPVGYGTRVHATVAPRLAEHDEALVCIRRGRQDAWDLGDIQARGALDAPLAELLRLLCRAGCSFLIAGRTGSGKTALLEALANSWPGAPHIITIEDHALEICVRSAGAWTRELVDTQRDPQAFGRAAREALRQTPGLLLPGETRGHEAGAILALALSGHAVITTLHARTAAEAVTRFAGYAAQPGAYMYEGRRDDALRDTCAAFDAVVRLDVLDAAGRRMVAELALLDGAAPQGGELAPRLVPLATAEVDEAGDIRWRTFARCVSGRLVWADGADRTPAILRERLGRMHAQEGSRPDTISAAVRLASERAARHLAAGEAARALAALDGAWRERSDARLLDLARQAVERAPEVFAALHAEALAGRAELERLIAGRRWPEARRCYQELTADIGRAAAARPDSGWTALEARIGAGLAGEAAAATACGAARLALRRGEARAAMEIVNAAPAEGALSPESAAALLALREAAAQALYERGDLGWEAAYVVRERRIALEESFKESTQ